MQRVPPLANPDDIDIIVIWDAIKSNITKLVIYAAAIGLLVYLGLSFVTPQYASRAQIIIENERTGFRKPSGDRTGDGGPPIDKETIQSQVQVLQSNDLAAKVVKKLKLSKKAEFNSALGGSSIGGIVSSYLGMRGDDRLPEIERIMKAYRKKLIVYPIKESRVISVEFKSSDPIFAAQLANELSNTYIEWLQTTGVAQNKGAQKWLGQEIDQLRKDVEAAETKLQKMRASTGLIPGQNNLTLNVQQLGEINSRLTLAKAQKSEASARAKLIRSMLREGAIETAPDVLKSRLIQRLLEQRIRVQRQIAELSATLLPAHPRMVQLRSELSGLRRQIRNEGLKLVKGLENEVKIARAKEASLMASIAELRKSTENQSSSQAIIRVLEREAKSKRELYEAYVSRLSDAGARQSALSVPIMARIFERATASSIPVFPRKKAIVLLAVAASLFLGLAFIVTRELLRGARSNAPVAAPSTPVTPFAPVDAPSALPGVSAQGVRLSTEQKPARDDKPEPELPVPPTPPSPPTLKFVAERLANGASGAEHGHRTLVVAENEASVVLIDWEEGDKSIANSLGLPDTPGMYDLMEERVNFADVICSVPGESMHLIRVGVSEESLDEAAEKVQLELILDALDETYDHIVAYGSYTKAQDLFRITEGRFDAGVTIGDETNRPNELRRSDIFLGYKVEGIDVQHYAPGKASASPIDGPETPAGA